MPLTIFEHQEILAITYAKSNMQTMQFLMFCELYDNIKNTCERSWMFNEGISLIIFVKIILKCSHCCVFCISNCTVFHVSNYTVRLCKAGMTSGFMLKPPSPICVSHIEGALK